ncbi:MAG: laminin G domain-containing protein [Candidatus Parvarchaeota archaeon]|nr:laminin G domain-containing protein [Candidatus Jingweiarchaeum tengchongense]MCW1300068.1 laminin G domain-containing protein [Candidatus Jingweiarchaeum tengchongense]MCW1304422.1 laminin G domain-containing protein [Candidatus Jingweiarchaeum tengchongense]MCW1310970.1 laminin G domain-containing protein [Candidatus Jingweiarchaeum tengchongense]
MRKKIIFSKWSLLNLISLVLLFLSLYVIFIGFNEISSITGFFIYETWNPVELNYVDEINFETNEPTIYNWILKNSCNLTNCTLTSVKISGYVIANSSGNLSIYLENNGKIYTILSKNFELNQTIVTENVTREQNITFVNETTNETITQTINVTEEINFTIEEPETFYFENMCGEICDILNLTDSTYDLILTFDGNMTIKIEKIDYKFLGYEPIQMQTLNQSDQYISQPVISPINQNIPSKLDVLTWDYSSGDKFKMKDGGLYFDGEKDYVIIKDSEKFYLNDNFFKIETDVKIYPNSSGTIISRNDYLNGKFFVLAVNSEGTIRFDIGDGDNSVSIETNKAYNDGKFHQIFVLLNQNDILLYVDGMLEAQGDISRIKSINSEVPISIGADVGYYKWTGQTFDNFNGVIKYVKIYK